MIYSVIPIRMTDPRSLTKDFKTPIKIGVKGLRSLYNKDYLWILFIFGLLVYVVHVDLKLFRRAPTLVLDLKVKVKELKICITVLRNI